MQCQLDGRRRSNLRGSTAGETPIEAPTPYGCNSGKLGTKLDSHSTSKRAQLPGWAISTGSALARLGRHDAIEGDVTVAWRGTISN